MAAFVVGLLFSGPVQRAVSPKTLTALPVHERVGTRCVDPNFRLIRDGRSTETRTGSPITLFF